MSTNYTTHQSSVRLNIIKGGDILKDNTPPPPEIIGNGVLLKKALLLIYGRKKVRKTFLALNLGIAIALGLSFCGYQIQNPQKVLMLSAEGGYYPTRERLKKMCNKPDDEKINNFYLCSDARIYLDDPNGLEELRNRIIEINPQVLIIDPLVRFHSADENSANEMARVLGNIRRLMEDHDLSVILIHHAGKNENSGLRGSSVISGEYDSCIHIECKGNMHTISFDTRHVETPKPRTLQFNTETFWMEPVITNKIAHLLHSSGRKMNKGDLANACKEADLYRQVTNAYRGIEKALKDNEIKKDSKGLYYV